MLSPFHLRVLRRVKDEWNKHELVPLPGVAYYLVGHAPSVLREVHVDGVVVVLAFRVAVRNGHEEDAPVGFQRRHVSGSVRLLEDVGD